MIGAVGIDSVDIDRMESAIKKGGERLERRLFRESEIAYCASRPKPSLHYGARFAAKEACMKCLGRGILGGLSFRDIETVRGEDGKPSLVLHGKARRIFEELRGKTLHLSMTHTGRTASAIVVMER